MSISEDLLLIKPPSLYQPQQGAAADLLKTLNNGWTGQTHTHWLMRSAAKQWTQQKGVTKSHTLKPHKGEAICKSQKSGPRPS